MITNEMLYGFLKLESINLKKRELLSFLWIMLILCVPTAIFGKYSNITKLIMLPIVALMSFWIVYFLISKEIKKTQAILFLASISTFLSISMLAAAYKITSSEMKVSAYIVLLILLLYILTVIMVNLNILRLIKKGHFLVENNNKSTGIIITASFMGLGIGRLFRGQNMSQDTVVLVLSFLLLILGFLFSMGTHNFMKYYFLKKINN